MVLEHVAVFNIKPQSTRSPKRENEKSAYCKREKETESKEIGREGRREGSAQHSEGGQSTCGLIWQTNPLHMLNSLPARAKTLR